jgi:cysteine desulfurase
MKQIYFDYAASTPVDPVVRSAMQEVEEIHFANPSSIHRSGQQSRYIIESARQVIGDYLQVLPRDLLFTSGGTESINYALLGYALSHRHIGNHIVTTAMEHPAVLRTMEFLENTDFAISYLKPDHSGIIDPVRVSDLLTDKTILVSVMMANNETGAIQPIAEIGQRLKGSGIAFHVDAVQAFAKLDFHPAEWNIDLLSASGHKIYGPKGTGLLYIRPGISLGKLMHGGSQESGRRPGTENISAIHGFSAAVKQMEILKNESTYITDLRDFFEAELLRLIPGIEINGNTDQRLYSHSNLYFPFISGDTLLLKLDLQGFALSSGSACSSGSIAPSHVLTAMGLDEKRVRRSLRFSFGRFTTKQEIESLISSLKKIYDETA